MMNHEMNEESHFNIRRWVFRAVGGQADIRC